MVIVPWTEDQFAWHLAVNLLVEINTFILTLRRNVDANSLLHRVCNVLFYTTWIVFRLVMLPLLVGFFYYEYGRYSESVQTPYNMMIVACVGEAAIACMSYMWTFDMILKLRAKEK